jgi:hypothetical protein
MDPSMYVLVNLALQMRKKASRAEDMMVVEYQDGMSEEQKEEQDSFTETMARDCFRYTKMATELGMAVQNQALVVNYHAILARTQASAAPPSQPFDGIVSELQGIQREMARFSKGVSCHLSKFQ